MKNRFIITLLCLFLGITFSQASVTLIMPHRSGNNGTQITIPVRVKDFSNIISAQGTLQFDQSILSFVSIQQYGLPDMNSGTFGTTQAGSGKLTFSWYDNDLLGVSVADSTIIFSVTFNITGTAGQVSDLSFVNSPAMLEIVNNAYETQTVLISNGSVTVSGIPATPDLSLYADTLTTTTGTQVSVSVRATDFININSCQGTLQFNPSVATYAGISFFGLPGMNLSNFGTTQVSSGKLMFSWNDGTITGQNMADHAPLFTVLFNCNGSAGTQTTIDFVNSPTPLEVTDSLFQVLNATTTSGRIKIAGATTSQHVLYYCDTVSAPMTSIVSVSMRAIDFSDIISLQGTLQFNPSIATFSNIDTYGLPDMTASSFGLTQVSSGKIMFSWNDPTLAGVSVPDSAILFTMKFQLTGAPGTFTLLNFINNPTPMETVNKDFLVVNDSLIPGKLRIISDGTITVSDPASLTYCEGDALTANYTVTGTFVTGNQFILQLSNASGSFATPINLDTVTSTASGLFSCSLPAGLPAGNGYRLRVMSTNPVLYSNLNPQNLTILATPGTPTLPSGITALCLNPANTSYSSSAANATSGQWSLYPPSAGVITATGPTGTVDWNDTFTGNAWIKVKGFNGSCPGPWSDSLMVTISDYPATAAKPSGDTLMCQNPGTTAYSTTAVPDADTYLWQLNPGTAGTISGSGTGINILWNASFTGTAYLTVAGTHAGCTGTVSPALSIVILSAPAQPALPAGNTQLCINNANTTYSVTPVSGATGYSWSLLPAVAGTLVPSGNTAEVNWADNYTGSAGIVVMATNGVCDGPLSDTLHITIRTLPAQPAQPTGPAEYCAGVSSTNCLTTGSANATGYTWGLWPAGAGTISGTGSSAVITWTPGWTGTAYIYVIANNDCGSSASSDSLQVIIHPLPAAPVITVNFNTLSSDQPSGNQWYFNGTLLNGQTGQDYIPTANGNYYVIYTDPNGCQSSSDTINVNFVGIAEIVGSEELQLYPNPSGGRFYLTLPQEVDTPVQAAVYDIRGKRVFEGLVSSGLLDLSELESGMYWLILEGSGTRLKAKVLLTH